MQKRNIGIMLSSEASKAWHGFPCALDNGAFESWRRGFPWSEQRFMAMLEKAWSAGLSLDFVVCPDIVAGGKESLEFSLEWRKRLRPARLALAVQDGMPFSVVNHLIARWFTHIFVGGSTEWKWDTAAEWVRIAHERDMKCHIGRCGTLDRLRYAKQIGADSVDSTSFVRNESWHIIDELDDCRQLSIFEEARPGPKSAPRETVEAQKHLTTAA
jgi:hypothetical protein